MTKPRFTLRQLFEGLQGATICLLCYLTLPLQPLRKRWGLTKSEVAQTYPGDHWIEKPLDQFNHAIEIRAEPDNIWPWIAQIGQGRGGFYSYEALENLFGYQIYNSDTILPQFQDVKVGDLIPFSPTDAFPVIEVEPPHKLIIGVFVDLDTKQPIEPTSKLIGNCMHVTWLFHIEPMTSTTSRLVSRCRVQMQPTWKKRLWLVLYEPVMFTMDRKMLIEIKRRVEATT